MLISFHYNENFIGFPIFLVLNIIHVIFETECQKNAEFLYYLISYISQILLIIFYFIEKYSSKNENKDIYNLKQNDIKSTIVFSIISFLIFNSINDHLYYLITIDKKEDFIIFVLFYILLERFIINNYFYSHHMVSAYIIFILFIYIFILKIIQSELNLFYILLILANYSYSFSILLIKYINTKYYINIYLLGSIRGIVGTIQFLIQKYDKNILAILDFYNIFFIILYFILIFFTNIFSVKIILKLTPLHSLIIDYITFFISNMILNKYIINDYIIAGLCIISSLIYLEILILNFCNLNKNIKINIIKRGEIEMNKEISSPIISLNGSMASQNILKF